MQFSLDRTGFPLVRIDELEMETTLLPITKVQFEAFLSDPDRDFGGGLYGDRWYDELLKLNPRVCPGGFSDDNRDRLFLTGIFPKEIDLFAAWLGGFELPTIDEWRPLDQALMKREAEISGLRIQLKGDAKSIVTGLYRTIQPRTLADLSLTLYGVIEWVRAGRRFLGQGKPREQWHPNTHNPRTRPDEVWEPKLEERHFAVGARLIRRLKASIQETGE